VRGEQLRFVLSSEVYSPARGSAIGPQDGRKSVKVEYEWLALAGGKRKQPYCFRPGDERPWAFAGLWERWLGPDGPVESCAILTTEANELVRPVHDRMPAILSREEAFAWLKTGDTALLKPCPSDALATWTVSTRVNSPANNDPALADEIAPAPEAGATAPAQEQTGKKPEQLSLLV